VKRKIGISNICGSQSGRHLPDGPRFQTPPAPPPLFFFFFFLIFFKKKKKKKKKNNFKIPGFHRPCPRHEICLPPQNTSNICGSQLFSFFLFLFSFFPRALHPFP
ncbi:hypothetical protein PanWU01x14_345660, partial [Parasponia andersonii]